ncbi:MAG: glycosyltransferase [Betaproteobacteria bacterium]
MPAPALTFVTTCKGRLHQLQQTLPLLADAEARCIVVDYGCPDRTGDWVEAHFPQVHVVRQPDATDFNPSRARNLGVEAAISDIICLIDADVRISPAFVPAILRQFDVRHYYVPEPLTGDVTGTFVCARAAFQFAEGYDEAFSGWGGEDLDLYERFELHGLQRSGFPAALLSPLAHTDAQRTRHHSIADKNFSNSMNLIYSHIKLDLMRLSRNRLPLEFRRTLYAQVRDACAASAAQRQSIALELPYAEAALNFVRLETTLVYRIDMSP